MYVSVDTLLENMLANKHSIYMLIKGIIVPKVQVLQVFFSVLKYFLTDPILNT